MSDNKKYYYLKLKDSFFDSEEMKILESQKNGIEYQNLYLKLCLLSLKAEGKLIFKDCLPYDINMLSTVLRANIDTVKTGIEIFRKLGLIDIMDTGLIFMTDIQSLIGKGSSEAERVKLYRERIKDHKELPPVQTYTKRTPELELELEIELEKEIDIEIKKERETGSAVPQPSKTKFIIPTLEEVKAYIDEKNIKNVDAEKFHAYYEANGWKVGRNPMKSWKASITYWTKNGFANAPGKPAERTEEDREKRRQEFDRIRKENAEKAKRDIEKFNRPKYRHEELPNGKYRLVPIVYED